MGVEEDNVYTICGQTSLSSYPAKANFTFNENDIWIAVDGDQITRIKNGVQDEIICLPASVSMSINKLWGSSSNDLYAVGNGGNIAHYNGSVWTKIESTTNISIRDIWGSVNYKSNQLEVICLASDTRIFPWKKLIKIKSFSTEPLPDSGLARSLSTIWFVSGKKYCIGGAGYYESKTIESVWKRDTTKPSVAINCVRGDEVNDIIVAGSFGLLLHYNGIGWENYSYITTSLADVIGEVAIKNNLTICVGYKGNKAVIIRGEG